VTLSAPLLHTLQRCPRQHALERDYRVLRVRPKHLLERLLRDAIFAISNGADPAKQATEACTRFLEAAARPGLYILTDPYTISHDFCAIIQTVLEAVSRLTLLVVKPGPVVAVGAHEWRVSAFQDESGTLHRWACVDQWDEDTKYRELHGWACFGDCAATEQGMILHVIEIGRQSKGHQHTAWCRAFKHPAIIGKYRFRKVDGGPLQGDWKPLYYQDSDKNNAKDWCDLMEADGLQLMHHVTINAPHAQHVEEFRREVTMEAKRAAAIGEWQETPRWRPSCDLPYPCPWQPCCFAPPGLVDVEAVGGFVRVDKKS